MRKIAYFVVVILIAANAVAELSSQLAAWGKGPVQHLMLADEKEEWAKINDNAEAEKFITRFWQRRDPTPMTAENENRELFEKRVEYAQQKYRTPKFEGAMTPMGKVLILLGSPRRVSRNTTGGIVSTQQSGFTGGVSMSVNNARGSEIPTEIWFYEEEATPKFSPMKAFEIAFTDQYGTQDWELSRTPRTNVKQLLDLGVASYLAPEPALQNAALRVSVDDFRLSGAPSKGNVHVTWGEYVTKNGQGFVSLQLYVPASARAAVDGADSLFALIENESGAVVGAQEKPATLNDLNGDAWTDFSLELPRGRYTGVVGLAKQGAPVVISRVPLEVKGVNATAPGTSQLILSNKVYPLSQAQAATDPYAFGGLKVVPKGDRTFRSSDELWYFLELRNPGVDASGQPSLNVKLDIEGKDKKLGAPMMKADTQPVKGVPGHFVTGSAIPLTKFGPGDYTIRVKVVDSVLNQKYEFEERFRIE